MAIGPPCHWRGRWRAPFLAGRVIRALNLPHHDGPVLGVDLNRYESIWLAHRRLACGLPKGARTSAVSSLASTVAERRRRQRLEYSFNGHAETQQLIARQATQRFRTHRQTVARKPFLDQEFVVLYIRTTFRYSEVELNAGDL